MYSIHLSMQHFLLSPFFPDRMVQENLIVISNAAEEAQNNILPLPHIPCTHINPTVIQNKEIEVKNDERALQTLNHMLNSVAFPDPDHFQVPTFTSFFHEYIYCSLVKWIVDEDVKEKEDIKLKRKTTDEPKLTQARFPQSLFDTEGCVAVPLPFFLNENLQILNAKATTLPTVKKNPNPGETKGISILDVNKLTSHFGKELSLTCSQWTKATGNMYLFQKEQDAVDSGDAHSDWYNNHFNFYQAQQYKVKLYDTWKSDKLKFCQEHWANYGAFEGYCYKQAFALSEKQNKMMAEIQELMATTNKTTFKRGHNSWVHNDSTIPVKFKDSKPTWAKYVNQALITPDNHVICINWNIRGSNAVCAHSKDECLHLCSFCGQKGHNTFSWTC
ncbi:hypothetical protein BYT27DRAFT_7315931 [Phlegmacium glaucopus]|nr:hypothetical protein BYT27DRAFT_7315931 [Phlegmacium glaucopus]